MNDLKKLQEYLAIPSVSTVAAGKAECVKAAEWLWKYFAEAGIEARLLPTKGNPVVYGKLGNDPRKKTILVYGHYDVQPTDPDGEWSVPPWSGKIEQGAIWGRGTSDNKGQFWCHMLALAEWRKTGKELPVNLKFVVEGEEEIGSPSMEEFIKNNAKLLAAEIVWISDGSVAGNGQPTIDLSLRGAFNAELKIKGPKMDLHSGSYGGAIANPINTLANVLAELADEAGVVKVPGFYDSVLPITKEQLAVVKAEKFDKQAFLAKTGAKGLSGEAEYPVPLRIGLRPTLQVTGISGGYTSEGFKNIVPKEAVAKLNFRLAPGQDWKQCARLTKKYLAKIMPKSVTWSWELDSADDAYLAKMDSPMISQARKVFSKVFGKETRLGFEGGSLPVANWFSRWVSQDVLLSGWAQDMHVVDEKLDLRLLELGVKAVLAYWIAVAGSLG